MYIKDRNIKCSRNVKVHTMQYCIYTDYIKKSHQKKYKGCKRKKFVRYV